MKLQVGVKALVKNSNDEFLFLLRSSLLSADEDKPSWDIPGGRINPGESLLDALYREIKEEIGYDLQSSPNLLAAQDILVPTKDLHVVRLTYMVEEDIPVISLSHEHVDYRWLTLDKLKTLNVEPVLARALENLQYRYINTSQLNYCGGVLGKR